MTVPTPTLKRTVPILRIFDVTKATEFYVDGALARRGGRTITSIAEVRPRVSHHVCPHLSRRIRPCVWQRHSRIGGGIWASVGADAADAVGDEGDWVRAA